MQSKERLELERCMEEHLAEQEMMCGSRLWEARAVKFIVLAFLDYLEESQERARWYVDTSARPPRRKEADRA